MGGSPLAAPQLRTSLFRLTVSFSATHKLEIAFRLSNRTGKKHFLAQQLPAGCGVIMPAATPLSSIVNTYPAAAADLIYQVFVCAPTPRRASLSSDLDCIIPEACLALPPASAGPPVPRVAPPATGNPSLRRDTLGLALVKQPHARRRSSSFTCARAAGERGKNVETAVRSRFPGDL
jgi:hypothetical protein